jgi:N-acetyl-anhydromuramyl-L-alanine amidase AmpD
MISLNKISMGLFSDCIPYANLEKDTEAVVLNKLNLKDIIQVDFPNDQYVRKQTDKKQIVLHHTVSGQGTTGDIAWWRQTTQRIGTAIIIDWEGKIYQCFSSKYWAYHLGAGNYKLDKYSIGIEIDSWGGLVKHNRSWYPAKWDKKLKKYIANISHKPIKNVQKYPKGFKGFYAYEKYTN